MNGSNDKDNSALDRLFDDLLHPNPIINKDAYMKMVKYWPEESLPRLLACLGHEKIDLRRVYVKALGAFGKSSLGPVIEVFKSTQDRTIRTSCIKVLVQIAAGVDNVPFPEEVIVLVEKVLEEENPEQTLTLVTLLRQLGEQGLPVLIKISRGKNLLGVLAAVTALGEINHPSARDCLEQLLCDETQDSLIHESVLASLSTFKS
ncbi:HEAT repeat domain-containing protein [Prochlorococcus sp. MIT 1300]|uniref:HEAT repeat domain-containing protein n=1 Tax=Prochlorococcus sp. MIT 1300 TaxID=3096218 RepID=UPI002A7666A1|nr:HEAT repeat domain-containing protein [Prochlorococcus sp. MIT 1300]